MSDAAGWYQRKLAALRQQRDPNLGITHSPNAPQYRAASVQYPPQYDFGRGTPQQYQQPTAPQYPQPQPGRVTVENLYEMAGQWRAGPGGRSNPDPCPRCGGNQYFGNLQVSKRGPQPAGHCYNCGYNDGMFDQGVASTWGAA